MTEERVSVHVASKKRMQVFDKTTAVFCLRSKRSEVRILSGVPLLKDLAASRPSKTLRRPFAREVSVHLMSIWST